MTRALVTQLVDALENLCTVIIINQKNKEQYHRATYAIEAAREYLATEPSGERAELIEKLRWASVVSGNETCGRAADMLEADAQQATPYGWMVSGVPTVMRGSLAQEIQEQEAKRIGGTCKAFPVYTAPQQAKRVPLSGEQIDELAEGIALDDYVHDLARQVEKHHGITPAEKPTVDEPEEEDLYALALKADNWGQP